MSINATNNTIFPQPDRNYAQFLEFQDGLSPLDEILIDDRVASTTYTPTKEIFLASDWQDPVNVYGLGTKSRPFNCSTRALFDSVIATIYNVGTTNVVFRLGYGEFHTIYGSWKLLQRWQIIGMGAYNTSIVQDASASPTRPAVIAPNAFGVNGNVVADLTVDAGYSRFYALWPDNPAWNCVGVLLQGSQCTISGVRAINVGTNDSEAFALAIIGDATHTINDALIENWVVEQCGDLCTGPVILNHSASESVPVFGVNAVIRNGRATGGNVGCQLPNGFSAGALVEGNVLVGQRIVPGSHDNQGCSLYSDTDPSVNVKVRKNHFEPAVGGTYSSNGCGLYFKPAPNSRGVVFYKNTYVCPNAAIVIGGTSTVDDVCIHDEKFYKPTVQVDGVDVIANGAATAIVSANSNLTNGRVSSCRADSRLVFYTTQGATPAMSLLGSVYLNGQPVSNEIISAATDAAKRALTNLAPGQEVTITGAANRRERYIGGTISSNANWKIIGANTFELFVENGHATLARIVNGISCPAQQTTSVGWIVAGATVPYTAPVTYNAVIDIGGVPLSPALAAAVLADTTQLVLSISVPERGNVTISVQ